MEDINFKKFICYILNCIGATESQTIFYVDNELKKLEYDGGKSKVQYDQLKCFYTAADTNVGGVVNGAIDFDVAVDIDIPYKILKNDASNIKQYFNIKQVPSYFTIKGEKSLLDVPQSIHQAFNLIKVFFDAKKWYSNQYQNNNIQNQMSYSSFNFKSDKTMFGGFEINYDNANKEVKDASSYNNFLANVLRDFIYMVSGKTDKIGKFDVTTLYVLSKINYYLAKRYAVLSIDKNPDNFYDALKKYNQTAAYDNSFFDIFTYYNKTLDDNDKNYPRYYQKQILDLLNVVNPTTDVNDVLSYLLVTETNEQIDPIADQITYDDFNKNLNRTEIYKSLFTNEKLFEYNHNEIKKKFNDINSFIDHIKKYDDTYRYIKINKDKITEIQDEIKIEEKDFKYHGTNIKNVLVKLTTATIAAITIIKKNMVEIANAVDAGTTAKNKVDADFVDGAAAAAIGGDIITIIKIAAAAGGATLKSYGTGDGVNIDDVINDAKAACNAAAGAVAGAGSINNKAKQSLNDDAKKLTLKQLILNAIKNTTAIKDIKGTVDDAIRARGAVAPTISTAGAIAAFTVIAYIISYTDVITHLVSDDNNIIKTDFIDIVNIARIHIQNNVANINNINIQSEINTTVCSMSGIKKPFNDLINTINEHKSNHVAALFKAIKTYIKKYSKDTFSSVYQSPTISYSLTPMNIRPLIDKRATESDLSNYAAQIASDSFLNSNKLPAIPEIKTLNGAPGIIGLMKGGSTDINNSSNVYRAIFNKILTTLNSKRIKLNEADKQKVDESLDKLERIEHYLKSTLSDYAKYASVPHIKGETIRYNDVRKFVNEYENKLREYNKNSAHMLKFIGKLTRYLIM